MSNPRSITQWDARAWGAEAHIVDVDMEGETAGEQT